MWTKIDIAVLYSMLHSQRPSLKCALICNKLIISNLNKVKKYYHDSFFRNKTSTEAFLGGDTIFYFCRGRAQNPPMQPVGRSGWRTEVWRIAGMNAALLLPTSEGGLSSRLPASAPRPAPQFPCDGTGGGRPSPPLPPSLP